MSGERIWLASMGMGVGGAERLVLILAEGLLARGHAVAVSGSAGPLDDELARLDVERLVLPERGRSPLGVAEAAARLAARLRGWRPTAVHAHNVRMTAVAGLAARAGRGPRRPPVVATFHGVEDAEYRTSARVLRAADAVACVSADLESGLRAQGYPPARLRVIPNAVPPPPPPKPALASELREGDAPLVVAVGRLVAQKNHERLLEAVAQMRRPATVWIVGDGPLRGRLEARTHELGVSGRVRFAGLRHDAREIIAEADLLAFSSDWEGLSVAAQEALAAGTPVVSTPVQGMAELLEGRAGIVAREASPDALAGALDTALGDPGRRAAMGAAALEIAGRHPVAAMLDAYERLYAVRRARGG